jgi:dTMP kinase
MQAKKGLFISFEGIDGAGKSTHINGLKNAFEAQGKTVVLSREPGGTVLAEQLRHLVLNQAMDPLVESLLVFAARRDHLNNVIVPALLAGHVVLCDRFTDATFAYQGAGRGFDLNILKQLEKWVQSWGSWPQFNPQSLDLKSASSIDFAMECIQPDYTIWFDLPPAEAAKRLVSARVPDRFESQPVAFFEAVVQGYQQRMDADTKRFIKVNANQSIEQVWQDLLHQLVSLSVLTASNQER